MFVFPLLATAISLAFTVAVTRTARARRSPALAVWAFALLQFAIASAALTWGVAFGWQTATFRVYYLFGAITNVAWLGLGAIWLLSNRPVAWVASIGVVAFCVAAALAVVTATMLPSAPRALELAVPRASRVLPEGVRMLSRISSIGGSVVVLTGLAWSVLRRRTETLGLLLLAAGIVVVAVASELARLGFVLPFSVGLATGIAVMYVGFRRIERPAAQLPPRQGARLP